MIHSFVPAWKIITSLSNCNSITFLTSYMLLVLRRQNPWSWNSSFAMFMAILQGKSQALELCSHLHGEGQIWRWNRRYRLERLAVAIVLHHCAHCAIQVHRVHFTSISCQSFLNWRCVGYLLWLFAILLEKSKDWSPKFHLDTEFCRQMQGTGRIRNAIN